MSFSYSNKNDFDDMNVYHQTKSPFKNEKQGLVKMQNSRRSTFIDCFTGDSIIAPATICPEGVNCPPSFPRIAESKPSVADTDFKNAKFMKDFRDQEIYKADQRVKDAERITNNAKKKLMEKQTIQSGLFADITRPRRPHDRNPIGEKILKAKHDKISMEVADAMRVYNTEKTELEKAKVLAANIRMAALNPNKCPPNRKWNPNINQCESFGNRAGILNPNKRKIIQNRKLSFFNSIVE